MGLVGDRHPCDSPGPCPVWRHNSPHRPLCSSAARPFLRRISSMQGISLLCGALPGGLHPARKHSVRHPAAGHHDRRNLLACQFVSGGPATMRDRSSEDHRYQKRGDCAQDTRRRMDQRTPARRLRSHAGRGLHRRRHHGMGLSIHQRRPGAWRTGSSRALYRGENPLEPERVSEKLHANSFWMGRGGSLTTHQRHRYRLWDILGKVTGQPIDGCSAAAIASASCPTPRS